MPASASKGDRVGACDTELRLGGAAVGGKQERANGRAPQGTASGHGSVNDTVDSPDAEGYQIDSTPPTTSATTPP